MSIHFIPRWSTDNGFLLYQRQQLRLDNMRQLAASPYEEARITEEIERHRLAGVHAGYERSVEGS